MKVELVSIPTETHPLDGVWCEPENQPVQGAALIMHGNQGNFYVGPPRFLPPALAELGLASLAYNRRGHDILATHRGRKAIGGALQLTEEAVADNRRAADFAHDRGFARPAVIGHSHGGLLGARHVLDYPKTPALVLLSAARGGPDATRIESADGLLLAERYSELVREASRLVETGRGDELMKIPGWWWVISAQSLVDRTRTLPDLVGLAPSIGCPTLFLKAKAESEARYPARAFAASCAGVCKVAELDCDHWYNGSEQEVAAEVTSWLARSLGLKQTSVA